MDALSGVTLTERRVHKEPLPFVVSLCRALQRQEGIKFPNHETKEYDVSHDSCNVEHIPPFEDLGEIRASSRLARFMGAVAGVPVATALKAHV